LNNLICIFFGHKDDRITFGEIKDFIKIQYQDVTLAYMKRCIRCGDIYIKAVDRLRHKGTHK